MAEVSLHDVRQALRRRRRRRPCLADGRGRRVRGAGRAVRLRQDDDAQSDRRADRADRRRHLSSATAMVNDLDPKDRDIAMVFQNYALYPNKTVYKNLAFPLQDAKAAEEPRSTEGRVQRTAKLLDIEHLLERRPARALRRPAAARGARPGAGARPARLPDGRAALESRRQAARADARRAEALPPGSERDHRSTSPTTSSRR